MTCVLFSRFPTTMQHAFKARMALAEMASDGLPEPTLNVMSVEVCDPSRQPIYEIVLTIQEIQRSVDRSSGTAPEA